MSRDAAGRWVDEAGRKLDCYSTGINMTRAARQPCRPTDSDCASDEGRLPLPLLPSPSTPTPTRAQ